MGSQPGTMDTEPKGKQLPVINNGNYLTGSTSRRALDHWGQLARLVQVKCLSYEPAGLRYGDGFVVCSLPVDGSCPGSGLFVSLHHGFRGKKRLYGAALGFVV